MNDKILKLIKEQKERTGLRIVDNVFDFGSCSVIDEDGKVLHRGDRLTCQFFINEYDALITQLNKQP